MSVACTLRSFITVVVVSLLAACGGGSGGSAEAKRTAEDGVSFLLLESLSPTEQLAVVPQGSQLPDDLKPPRS
ncbi:MAG: hypothetical protein GY938_22070 [Ketobacter sp.]|nr:hypothetical protein [Ketobacter sp.]